MKKTGAVCVLFALLVGTLITPADAAQRRQKKITREATDDYGLPWMGSPSVPAGGCVSWQFRGYEPGNPCPRFALSISEGWVTMELTDSSDTPTAFTIRQVTEEGLNEETTTVGGPFCGSTGKEPVKLTPGLTVTVRVYANGDTLCPGAFGTSGTVKAVFSNVP